MFEVTIRGDSGGFLIIKLLSRSYPDATNYWDGNWINAAVEIEVGGFHGSVVGYLRAEELAQFLDQLGQLQSSLSGTASFETMEDWLSISASGVGRGHIVFKCVIRDRPGIGNTLNCELSTDQTFTQSTVQDLADAVKAFPVIGSP